MPRVDAVRRMMEHLAGVRSPLVLITAPYGSESTSLIQQVEQALPARFEPWISSAVEGQTLQRRLDILEDLPEATAYQVAQHMLNSSHSPLPGELPRMLLISNIELLDQDSSVVLDVLVREQRVGLMMTCASASRLSFRYSRPMQGPRGLTVQLPELSEAECRSLLNETLGAPPTQTLTDYLYAITARSPQELRIAAQAGLDEGWIGIRGTHSALLQAPAWMDNLTAADILDGLQEDLGTGAVQILQRIAVRQQIPLGELTDDAETRDAVFWMLEAGLLAVTDHQVHLHRSILRHPLLLSAPPANSTQLDPEGVNAQSASAALHRMANAETLDEPTLLSAATEHLERGLLEQARFLAGGLPEDDPGRLCLTASVQAASGACRRALQTLRGADRPEATALRSFISAALLSSPEQPPAEQSPAELPSPEQPSPRRPTLDQAAEGLEEFSARLRLFDDFKPHHYLEAFPAVPAAPQHNGHQPWAAQTRIVDVEGLVGSSRAALDAYAAALADDTARAHASWQATTAIPVAQLPVVAAGWVIERAGMSRIFNDPGAELFPAHWFAGETPERRLRYELAVRGQRLLQGLVCGAETEQLRRDTEDLWQQFEAGLPAGSLSRRFLEAMDHAIAGRRTADLKGPPELAPPELASTFRDATVDTVALLGRLLRTEESALTGVIDEVFHHSAATPGVRRTALRCLLLRRGAQLPPQLLNTAVDYARRAQVKKEVLDAAEQLNSGPQARKQVLGSPVPGLDGLRFCHEPTQRTSAAPQPAQAAAARLLSKRENEIVKHLMAGAGATDVAEDLSISVRTVHTHVRNIYRKLGVASRTQLHARLSEAPHAAEPSRMTEPQGAR